MRWKKLGRILAPDPDLHWMVTHAGPSFALAEPDEKYIRIYVTGRDAQNRSKIGLMRFDMDSLTVRQIGRDPVLELGERGTFDQNGTSYPWLLKHEGRYWMYYTGWIPGVLVSFINDLGLAYSDDGLTFSRHSRATILPRTNEEPFGAGSVCVMVTGGKWRMWYTSFDRWGAHEQDHKHYYTIKVAESDNGIDWKRLNKTCIPYREGEYSIAKPSVLRAGGLYHMWYSYRGKTYRIGYATSRDGIEWERRDDLAGISVSPGEWDGDMVCYSHVFTCKGGLYMIYNGDGYGQTGLGLAQLEGSLSEPGTQRS